MSRAPISHSVLVIAPQFPPSSLAGVHRARSLCNHLRKYGWDPIVVTIDPADYEGDVDPDLCSLVDPTLRIIRVRAWPAALTRRFGIGDMTLRGFSAMASAAEKVIRTERPAVVFTTILPTYHTLFVARLSQRFRVPMVLDYQDPWVTRSGHSQSWRTRAGLTHRLATVFEPRVLRWTSHVTAVSEGTWRMIQSRHPQLPDSHFTTLPIGGDPADFAALRHDAEPTRPPSDGRVRFAYIGTIWPRVMDTLRALLTAIRQVRDDAPDTYQRLRFEFVGTQYGPPASLRPQVTPLAEELGVADVVHEQPRRVGYLEALRAMTTADVLLILGSDEPHYTASKLYPYLMSGTPILSVVHEDSEVTGLARACGGVRLVTFSHVDPVKGKVQAIATAIRRMAERPADVGEADLRPIRHLFADEIARQVAAVFDRVASRGFSGPRW